MTFAMLHGWCGAAVIRAPYCARLLVVRAGLAELRGELESVGKCGVRWGPDL
jgi:hypothetical protein